MTINTTAIMDLVVSHAMTLGVFEKVNGHEPKNAPGNGLNMAVWLDSIAPFREGSGMDSTSGRVVLNVRVYSNMVQEPQDNIDPNLLAAVDLLFSVYSGDFELAGNVRCIDLLGMSGVALSGQAGYVEQDKKMFRIFTITLPFIINDLWNQVA